MVWYLDKEKRYGIETLSNDIVLNEEYFLWKNHAENVHKKLALDPFFILVNNPKQSLHAKIPFKNKIFWEDYQKPLQKLTFFFFKPSPFNRLVIKNKRGLEQATSRSSGYEISSQKFIYELYINRPSLML